MVYATIFAIVKEYKLIKNTETLEAENIYLRNKIKALEHIIREYEKKIYNQRG